ncbi:plancitoxin-1-like [Amphiura filiformis]|uniref:plancitoxin-1-like n=1 Tax=Amphiura filiformis TaxID=82378 RepID=UPI003B21A256
MTGNKVLLVAWISLVCVFDISYSLTCLDQTGNPVSWFIALNLPKNTSPIATNGKEFMYMDANIQRFQKSPVPLDNINQAIGLTLHQVYTNYGSQNVAYGMYSDQPPPDGGTSRGHIKGVVALDATDGFWLVHSVPRFPNQASGGGAYSWPPNAETYGQSLLCISFNFNQFEEIGQQLLYACPNTYESQMPPFTNVLPILQSALGEGPCIYNSRSTVLQATNGQQFVSFAKSVNYNLDLYSGLVAPYFQKNLFTETWQHDSFYKIPSYCGNPQVVNINRVQLGFNAPGYDHYEYLSTSDHSKWAVASDQPPPPPNQQVVCIGDINREYSQVCRAGGTVCMVGASRCMVCI